LAFAGRCRAGGLRAPRCLTNLAFEHSLSADSFMTTKPLGPITGPRREKTESEQSDMDGRDRLAFYPFVVVRIARRVKSICGFRRTRRGPSNYNDHCLTMRCKSSPAWRRKMARASPPPLFGIPNQCFRFDCVGQLRSIRHRTTSVPKSASPGGRGERSTLTGRSARSEDLVGRSELLMDAPMRVA
jgi:hypothetical protein